jgi:magnesium transporter
MSVWLDLVDPTHDELLAAAPALDPSDIELLAAAPGDGRQSRPQLEGRGSSVVGTLLLPVHVDDRHGFDYLEIDVVATLDRLLTVRKTGPGRALVDVEIIAHGADAGLRPGAILHLLVDYVADAYLDLLDALYGEIDELEDHVDDLSGEATRQRLSALRHEMLLARRNVSGTRAAVRRVVDGRVELRGDEQLFPREIELSFADTYDTLVRATEELDVARDLLASVRDYLQAKISESQNEVVKKLTVTASLVLVPTLITGFFGQNFAGVFDERWWTVGMSLGLIAFTTVAQLAFFRWKRWI